GVSSDKGNIIIRSDNAFIPASVKVQLDALGITQLNLRSSNSDIQPRESNNMREVMRTVVGFEGSYGLLGENWRYDGYWQRGKTTAEESLYTSNTARLALAQDAVLNPDTGEIVCRSTLTDPANGCVPFNRMGIGV